MMRKNICAAALPFMRELHDRSGETVGLAVLDAKARKGLIIAAVQDKLLRQGRGGYCFELNRLYLLLLQELGFDARGLTGRASAGPHPRIGRTVQLFPPQEGRAHAGRGAARTPCRARRAQHAAGRR